MAPELDSRDWHGFSFGDYDGDGHLDVYVSEGAKGNRGGTIKRDLLFRGNGDGTFSYVSDSAGIETSMHRGRCGAWIDYDNDGLLDLFVKYYGDANVLYKNNGNGTFTLVDNAGGLASANGSIVSFADYDNDGFLDVAITGDGNTQELYHNERNGTFVDVTDAAGIVRQPNGKGIAWGDYNNDGFPDLAIARGHQGAAGNGISLYRNNGDGTFTDVTHSGGVQISGSCWAAVWGDYDNDGYLDLFVTDAGDTGQGPGDANRLFHNNRDGTFTDVAVAQGVALQDNVALHKGAAWVDYNNDGFLDLMVKNGIGNEGDNGPSALGLHILLKNRGNGNHFVKVNLRGIQSNLHGIGARVTVTSSNGTAYRQNNGGGGGEYASQSSEPLHFGIGTAATADVEVRWPSGVDDTVRSVAANSTITVSEGGGPTPTPTPAPPVITVQPRNRTVTVGQTATFFVGATGGSPLSYQWSKNGSAIEGASNTVYVTPPTTLLDNGSVFSVVVSNGGGSVTSRNARLAVNP